ncbi:MAG: hypothetical protein K8I60_13150 [Anaerolineae bacterium]|nr:hypothetical protein [Anaerolineae bacterium]
MVNPDRKVSLAGGGDLEGVKKRAEAPAFVLMQSPWKKHLMICDNRALLKMKNVWLNGWGHDNAV